MKRVRYWSANNARWLRRGYQYFESGLVFLHPVLKRLGYPRLERSFAAVEKVIKGFLFDSPILWPMYPRRNRYGLPHELPQDITQWPLWWRAE